MENRSYLITFAVQLKNRQLHINRLFAAFLLWVFAIALTPWSSFHHHEEEIHSCVEDGKTCMHRLHIGHESHHCLTCSAHFEKDYTIHSISYSQVTVNRQVLENQPLVSIPYTALISIALRGPPAL